MATNGINRAVVVGKAVSAPKVEYDAQSKGARAAFLVEVQETGRNSLGVRQTVVYRIPVLVSGPGAVRCGEMVRQGVTVGVEGKIYSDDRGTVLATKWVQTVGAE